jgi:diguanylate cyclase (GGDEF)-like protein
MYSLFYVLSNQHRDDFAPFRCNGQTVSRLVRYFEDVVTEHKLSALVIEGHCLDGDGAREAERIAKLSSAARHLYLFSCDRTCNTRTWTPEKSPTLTELEEREYHTIETGPFILVMDSRFSGLLASYAVDDGENHGKGTYELVWTFDPNVVFTAIEYLMARVSVQKPWERSRFETLLNECTPHSSSLRMALTFTTKLAKLMQRQNEMEMAINSISSAISSTLEIEQILQSAVEEVGRAMRARRAAIDLWTDQFEVTESLSVYEREGPRQPGQRPDSAALAGTPLVDQPTPEGLADQTEPPDGPQDNEHITAEPLPITSPGDYWDAANSNTSSPPPVPEIVIDLSEAAGAPDPTIVRQDAYRAEPRSSARPAAVSSNGAVVPGELRAPITYRDEQIGLLIVEDDTPGRSWESEEVLMVRTVSDQLAVAIMHARLFKQVQNQAMTDSLTSLYNHGAFKERLDREIKLAERNGDRVSLILLDLDHLKRINDTFGHRAGDECLIHVSEVMRQTVREVDICARYGGEEFVVILPQCSREDAISVAERLREAISSSPVKRLGQRVDQITASVGVSTYPAPAKTADELIEMADRAMYLAKAAGRNRVRTLSFRAYPEEISR